MSNSYRDFFEKAQTQKGVRKALPAPVPRKSKVAKPQRRSINPVVLSLTLCGFLITLTGTFYIEEIERFLGKIEIGIFAKAGAEEPPKEKKEEPTKADPNSTSNPSPDSPQGTSSKNNESTVVDDIELNHFARLRDRKKELDKREEDLNRLEAEISQQREEVEQKLKELEDVRRKISSVLEEKVQVDDQRVENLVQFYSNMKAPQAAKIIETIDEGLAVQVIARMKKKNAADIMNLLKPEKAQAISERYVGYRK